MADACNVKRAAEDDYLAAIMAGLLPIAWGGGTGSEAMRRIAAPMPGGMISSTTLMLMAK